MKVTVTYSTQLHLAQELDLIENLCKFEGIECLRAYPGLKSNTGEDAFRKYYKGGRPAIIIDDGRLVVYGFWQFAEYLLKNGMLRC